MSVLRCSYKTVRYLKQVNTACANNSLIDFQLQSSHGIMRPWDLSLKL
jgi:hypothetical protein